MADPLEIVYRGKRTTISAELVAQMVGPCPPQGFPTNGAGPERLGPGRVGRVLAWIITQLVPDKLHGMSIWPAATFHDYHYGLGKSWADRRRADYRLGLNILIVATSES